MRKLGRRTLLIVDDAPIMGGAEAFALRVARYAAANLPEYKVMVVCPRESLLAEQALAAALEVHDQRFPDLLPRKALRIATAAWDLRRLLKDTRPAVAVGTTVRAQAYLVAASLGLRSAPPVVHVLLEQETAARRSARLVFRRFGIPVAVGDNARRRYQELLAPVQVHGLNNVFDPEELRPRGRPSEGSPDQQPTLGVLARLIPQKGVLELVEELAPNKGGWQRLLIAGPRQDADYARRIEARIRELGLEQVVELVGQVDSGELLGRVDALIVPSVGVEGQPTVIMEALACGVPVIVREHVWSTDFRGLPVMGYANGAELRDAISTLPRDVPPLDEVLRRFGPLQAVRGIEAAVAAAQGSRVESASS